MVSHLNRHTSKLVRYFTINLIMALLMSFGALAQNTTSNIGGMGLTNDAPIEINTENMDINDAASTATFTGDVRVKQGATTLNASKLVVHYGGDGSITSGTASFEKIELVGNVRLAAENQTATADAGTINMETEVLVLTGNEVVLTQGQNIFVGCKLTVQMKSGNARLESCSNGGTGRVTIQLDPKSREQ